MSLNKLFLALICAFTFSYTGKGQCSVTINSSGGGGGQMTFTAIATPTNVGFYNWDLGNNTFSASANLMVVSAVYTSNTVYTTTCTYFNSTLGCTVSASIVFPIVTACSLSINYTPPNPLNACNGSATLTNLAACQNPTTSWSNGAQGNVVTGLCANTLYTVVTNNANNCCPNLQGSVLIPNCNLVASLSRTLGPNGMVNFASTSTGTNASTTYTIVYGDGSSASSVTILPSHTYSSNGTYTVDLYASNNTTNNCVRDTSYFLNITNIVPCNLNSAFTYTINNDSLKVLSTSTGTLANTIYNWDFGDNSTASGASTNHTYLSSGAYMVKLIAVNPPACVDTAKTLIPIFLPVPCSLTADFTHTLSNGGQVTFSNTSVGTGTNTYYSWNFGDGIYSNVNSPTHIYNSAGAYNVSLKIVDIVNSCSDSTIYSINVTGLPCLANSNFSLSPTGQPQYWNAIPAYPWNVTNATWYWGDGLSSNGLYASHTYSVAGTYDICLTVTVSCGSSDSACVTSSIYKTTDPANLMVYVNVKKPALSTGINLIGDEIMDLEIYPNPNNGEFILKTNSFDTSEPMFLIIYDALGKEIYSQHLTIAQNANESYIRVPEVASGLYMIRVNTKYKSFSRKIIFTN